MKALLILEVSRKQDYIFSSNRLKDNARRSQEIAYVTSPAYFIKKASELYSDEKNLVYSGGGHTVLQFETKESAKTFAERITEEAMRDFDGMELYARICDYRESETPGKNLHMLTSSLEEKKALRKSAFRRSSLGVERLGVETKSPVRIGGEGSGDKKIPGGVEPPDGYEYPAEFEKVAGDDNFIAVVHIDGNSMGARVNGIYEKHKSPGDWEACRESLKQFSDGIQKDFENAFSYAAGKLAEQLSDELSGSSKKLLPIRPIIIAGDDVLYVTSGKYGLETARIFLEKLAETKNEVDGELYAACGGVAIVHTKYPFHRAYELSEELCSSAKRFGVSLRDDGSVSALDWHIEFGQLKDGLGVIREDYETDDGNRLELRPVAVVAPQGTKAPDERTYGYFRELSRIFANGSGAVARSKLKGMRTALKQGEVETEFYLKNTETKEVLGRTFDAKYISEESRFAEFAKALSGKGMDERVAFRRFSGEDKDRCVLFDALETSDHFELIGGDEK